MRSLRSEVGVIDLPCHIINKREAYQPRAGAVVKISVPLHQPQLTDRVICLPCQDDHTGSDSAVLGH